MLLTREAGNDTGSKLNALIRRLCKCVARKELDRARKSASDSPVIFGSFGVESGSVRLCCGSISSLTELNRTAGETPTAACASKRAGSFFKVSERSFVSDVLVGGLVMPTGINKVIKTVPADDSRAISLEDILPAFSSSIPVKFFF